MEKYRVFIGEKEYLVEIEGDRVWIDSKEVYAGIHFLNDDGLFMIERDESKREFHIKSREEDIYQVTTRGLQVDTIVQPEKKKARKREEKKDVGAITAPIPGVVMNVLVENGVQVEANQVLLVLESMKMLMEFRAPFEGTIEKVFVSKGQNVEKGDEMVRLKKSGE
ncbi:MAG TPA: acetyl-CoA carboxylase biotin carboxyl carrier protein subunit [Pelolinea sp.]|nr:acetyl-CoA carboxylase biotin carboxyl carrier protein subunit [Pelolinea sp.]